MKLLEKHRHEFENKFISQSELIEFIMKFINCNYPTICRNLACLRMNGDLTFVIACSNEKLMKIAKEKEFNAECIGFYNKILKKIERDDILEEIKQATKGTHAASRFNRLAFFYKVK